MPEDDNQNSEKPSIGCTIVAVIGGLCFLYCLLLMAWQIFIVWWPLLAWVIFWLWIAYLGRDSLIN